MDFRPIYAALATRLATDLSGSVVKVSRQNLPAKSFPDQPALVVLEDTVTPLGATEAQPLLWQLGAILVLHSRIVAQDLAPGEQVLDLISKIEAALRWRQGEAVSSGSRRWTTLGGLAIRAWMEEITVEDDIDDPGQASTIIRVKMLVHDSQ